MTAVTIYLSNEQNISQWIRREMRGRLNKRYKITHLSEDMGIHYAMLYRFLCGKNVGAELYEKFFALYLRGWNS